MKDEEEEEEEEEEGWKCADFLLRKGPEVEGGPSAKVMLLRCRGVWPSTFIAII